MCFGLPGRLIEAADADTGLALVDVGGRPLPVNMALLCEDPPVCGDWVLIHAGFALSRLAEADALAVLDLLDAAEHADAD
ncbi:HypC/HybG/HupF family hydrogenase formation chaperone [Thermopolyspora sp. NPDC052614]|uniref:HypC/HybG/HupF family hydrogenase formation chaperone n=1 Tax=Thermopolyspora sp. NPDC052614 TaxID=3155682 RepID=UPI00341C3CBD